MTRDMKASELMAKSERWIEDNPDCWAHICRLLDHEVSAQRRCSMQWATEEARKKSFVDRYGDPSFINNTLRSSFVRIYIQEHPEAQRLFDIRRSRVDDLFFTDGQSSSGENEGE